MKANRTGNAGGQAKNACQVDASVKTNFEFAKELGATGYANNAVPPYGQTAGAAQQKITGKNQ